MRPEETERIAVGSSKKLGAEKRGGNKSLTAGQLPVRPLGAKQYLISFPG
jgi:hypothetical protein